jgi:nucleotide-binding universal stress UspA family protein
MRKECEMTYKTLLVHVNESKHALDRINLAARLALDFHAHLIGVASTTLPGGFYVPGAFGESNVTLNSYLQLLREQAKTALAELEAVAANMTLPSCETRTMEDEAGSAVSLLSRYADLVIVGQIDPAESLPSQRRDLPEYILLNSGRPVLVVPYTSRIEHVGKRIMVAWDGSKEAARAVSAALPFLSQADTVQVVIFRPRSEIDIQTGMRHPGSEAALFLERHGIKAEVVEQATPAGVSVGDALLGLIRDANADMLVMGGYGHSRFREVLLGGVTRTVLGAMRVPTLMAH